MKLKKWTAKQTGGKITINGFDAVTGDAVKITGCSEIYSSDHWRHETRGWWPFERSITIAETRVFAVHPKRGTITLV